MAPVARGGSDINHNNHNNHHHHHHHDGASRRNDDDEREISSRTPLLKPSTDNNKNNNRPGFIWGKIFELLQDWWLWELIAIGTSIASMVIIAVILFLYDASSLPDWPSVFTVR
jgi:ABC-type Zn2+ transport system substrate-binding protein/surface adhesin